ncbi:hypothetical protein MGI18_18330 [Bacillus sp. OVS6]|nr:hypothetical protein MGI18_18330 [Bacillus sp. OVS6]
MPNLLKDKKGRNMKKYWVISITLSILIISAGVFGYFRIQHSAAENVFAESEILLEKNEKQKETELELKEIIREAQKKVVMVELADGTVGSGFLYNKKETLSQTRMSSQVLKMLKSEPPMRKDLTGK